MTGGVSYSNLHCRFLVGTKAGLLAYAYVLSLMLTEIYEGKMNVIRSAHSFLHVVSQMDKLINCFLLQVHPLEDP